MKVSIPFPPCEQSQAITKRNNMTAKELKEWLQDVPDDAELIGAMADDPENTYVAGPIYHEENKQIVVVLG